MTEWLIASNNRYKTKDLIKALAFFGLNAVGYTDVMKPLTFPSESTVSYETNALVKAQFLAQHTDERIIADDSGIEIPALGHHLGVTTKRELHLDTKHSDNETILNALAGVSDRRAVMTSALVALIPGKSPVFGVGRVSGVIAEAPAGTHSTGFDKIFSVPELGHTLAELPDESRIPLTHRGRAAQQLVAKLRGV